MSFRLAGGRPTVPRMDPPSTKPPRADEERPDEPIPEEFEDEPASRAGPPEGEDGHWDRDDD